MADLERFEIKNLEVLVGASGESGNFQQFRVQGVHVATGFQAGTDIQIVDNGDGLWTISSTAFTGNGTIIGITGSSPISSGTFSGVSGANLVFNHEAKQVSIDPGNHLFITGTYFNGQNLVPAGGVVFIQDGNQLTISGLRTGDLNNTYYPLNENPAGYLTSATAGGVNKINDISGEINIVGASPNINVGTFNQEIQITGSGVYTLNGLDEHVVLQSSDPRLLISTGENKTVLFNLDNVYSGNNPSGYLVAADISGVNTINGFSGNVIISSSDTDALGINNVSQTVILLPKMRSYVTGSFVSDPTFRGSGEIKIQKSGDSNILIGAPFSRLTNSFPLGHSIFEETPSGYNIKTLTGVSGLSIFPSGGGDGILVFATNGAEISGGLDLRLTQTGVDLINLIEAGNTGVLALNGQSGFVNLIGVSGMQVFASGANSVIIGRPITVNNVVNNGYINGFFENNENRLDLEFNRTGFGEYQINLKSFKNQTGDLGTLETNNNQTGAWGALDNSTGFWYPDGNAKRGWWQINFDVPQRINKYFYSGENILGSMIPASGWDISGYDFCSKQWSLLDTQTGFSSNSGWFYFDNSDYYSKYRMHIFAAQSNVANLSVNISELDFFDATGDLTGLAQIQDLGVKNLGQGIPLYKYTESGIHRFLSFSGANIVTTVTGDTLVISGDFYPTDSNPSGYLTAFTAGGVNKVNNISGNVIITGATGNYIKTQINGQTLTISGENFISGKKYIDVTDNLVTLNEEISGDILTSGKHTTSVYSGQGKASHYQVFDHNLTSAGISTNPPYAVTYEFEYPKLLKQYALASNFNLGRDVPSTWFVSGLDYDQNWIRLDSRINPGLDLNVLNWFDVTGNVDNKYLKTYKFLITAGSGAPGGECNLNEIEMSGFPRRLTNWDDISINNTGTGLSIIACKTEKDFKLRRISGLGSVNAYEQDNTIFISGQGTSDSSLLSVTGQNISNAELTGVSGLNVFLSGNHVVFNPGTGFGGGGGGAGNSNVRITGSSIISNPDFSGSDGVEVILNQNNNVLIKGNAALLGQSITEGYYLRQVKEFVDTGVKTSNSTSYLSYVSGSFDKDIKDTKSLVKLKFNGHLSELGTASFGRVNFFKDSTPILTGTNTNNDDGFRYYQESAFQMIPFYIEHLDSGTVGSPIYSFRIRRETSATTALFNRREDGGFTMGASRLVIEEWASGIPIQNAKNHPYSKIVERYTGSEEPMGPTGSAMWHNRAINHIETNDENIVELPSSGFFKVSSGNYRIACSAPASYCNGHILRLYNSGENKAVITGQLAYAETGNNFTRHMTTASLNGKFTLTGSGVMQLQHGIESLHSSGSFGLNANPGTFPGNLGIDHRIFTEIELWKLN